MAYPFHISALHYPLYDTPPFTLIVSSTLKSGPVASSVVELGLVKTDITAREILEHHAAYQGSTALKAGFTGDVLGYVTPVSERRLLGSGRAVCCFIVLLLCEV